MRRMTLPPEALLLRRMEGLLFQIASTRPRRERLGRAAAGADRGRGAVGELGVAHADWLATRR